MTAENILSLLKDQGFGVSFLTSIFSHQKHSVSYGLSHGGLPILCDRWPLPYVYGNREQFCGAYDEVGMYVS
jgi:hypothetical protein